MRKIYDLDPHFATGEATVQPVLLWGANGRPLRENYGTKTASEALDFIRSVQPIPGKSIVLVLALGAYETYDLNRNGDGFNEFAYRLGQQPTCGCCRADNGAWLSQDEILPAHYSSFESYGKVYRHHQNTDPLKGCGDVIKAFWNPLMHRVELLLGVDNAKAPDLAERIADREYPAVSMGCRIKYDVCTICGHRAPTRKQYCDHLKFGMRQVTKSGLRAGALNPSPRFFDISFVVRPADQTGYMMKKVAEVDVYEVRTSSEAGEYLDRLEQKRAELQKLSDIDKVIRGLPVDHKVSPLTETEAQHVRQYSSMIQPAVQTMPVMDDTTLTALSKHPVAHVLATLSSAGVILTTPEFIKLMMARLAPGVAVPEETLSAAVAMQGQVFDFYAQHPQLLEQLMATELFKHDQQSVKPEISAIAQRYLEKRATVGDYLQRALVPQALRPEEPRWTDTLTVSDPGNGQMYQTTRGAARDAHDMIAKQQLMKSVGGAALLSGAYKLLTPNLPTAAHPLAAATMALIGARTLAPNMGPMYRTEEGELIPTRTELQAMKTANTGVGLPILGSAALVAALGHDYESRLRRGYMMDHPEMPVHRRLVNHLGAFASDHPALAFLGSLAAYGGARGLVSKFAEYMQDVVALPYDSVRAPVVNVDRMAEKLGHLVVR
jgi:hypothetical protein